MQLGLNGKTALITGGERGIGQAIALAFAEEGARVAIADRRICDGPESTVEILKAKGVDALALSVDISRENEVIRMVKTTIDKFGTIDVFVNNAGIHHHEPVTKITTDAYKTVLDTNLSAAIWGCREVCRHMIARRQGVVILVASTIVLNPGYKEAVYRMSKAGLRAYAGTLALEMAPYGIRACTVSPGIIQTSLSKGTLELFFASRAENRERLVGSIPLRRLGEAQEIASFVVFLASGRATYATGCDVVVDGGFSLRPLLLINDEEVQQMNDVTN